MGKFNYSNKKLKRIKELLLNHKARIFLVILLYPNIVCFKSDPQSASSTFVDIMMGLGKYANVLYSCASNRPIEITNYSYFDYGIEIRHQLDEFNIGCRGGGFAISDSETEKLNKYSAPNYHNAPGYSSLYINPYIGLNTKPFELNVGLLFLSNTTQTGGSILGEFLNNGNSPHLTGDIRIGNKRAFHFTAQYLSNAPILSGSLLDIGFGIGSKESRNKTWFGVSLGPFQNIGFSLKQNIQLTEKFDLLFKGRIGQIESNLEGSISGGIRYNF